jgi:hypothetical protein
MTGTVILVDTSGSMNEPAGTRRRIDVMADIFKTVLPTAPTGTRLFGFDSVVRELDPDSPLPEPGGATMLHTTLEHVAPLHPRQVIIISDGAPSDTEAALAAARALECHITTHYAGDERDHAAIAFLHALSWCSSDGLGRATVADLAHPDRLAADLKLALTAPGSS